MSRRTAATDEQRRLLHTDESFFFDVPVSLDQAFPLFGPLGERAWAGPSWRPDMLHPVPHRDVEGAVFLQAHLEGRTAVWTNTCFDRAAGRAQYVYLVPGRQVALIDLTLSERGGSTHVTVRYRRTALAVTANREVRTASRSDARSGPKWKGAIERALSKRRGEGPATASQTVRSSRAPASPATGGR